ncbi:hypothetical protein [Frateuria sp. STR12]|uniref:hypothetical protein n=1 Tax=Frateuria hangzhouensis TaxID=2995589 RepID=UPI002260961F|nr:hypothetical protein [Frateuria sp. STR12]MCX7513646.1 hypothetical protein [Frateuria sp. STR12]
MLSRFFHVRSALKPFAAPAASPTVSEPTENPGEPLVRSHADYDRHPLETAGFDHYVEWNEDNERFLVH